MPVGALTEVGKISVGLSRAKQALHLLLALPIIGGSPEWDRLRQATQDDLVIQPQQGYQPPTVFDIYIPTSPHNQRVCSNNKSWDALAF